MAEVSVYDRPYDSRTLWIGWLSGPVVYSIYFLIVYTLGEFGCLAGIQRFEWFGLNVITLGTAVFTAIAALITLVIGFRTFRRWRRIRSGNHEWQETSAGFMSFTGAIFNALFTGVTLLTGISAFVVELCEWV